MAHPLRPTNFLKYAKSPLLRYVLPIIPVGATLKATSSLTPAQLGKIPGVISGQNGEWVGFAWQSNATTQGMLMAWQAWQSTYNVTVPLAGRLGDMIVAIDLDIENEPYLNAVRNLATAQLGETPVVRRRDGSIRCVLLYRHKAGTPPIRKFAGAYLDEQGQKQLVETLGTGQQVVLEGPHAKGAMHYWESDRELVDYLDKLPEITVDQVSTFYKELDGLATVAFDYTKHKLSLPGGGGGSDRPAVMVSDPSSSHLADDRELLTRALQHIDLDHPDMDYDAFIRMLRAICAAVGGDLEYMREAVWPWVCTNQTAAHGEGPRTEDQGLEWLEERWVSFTDSQVGAEDVYRCAADFGFMEGVNAVAAKEFERDDTGGVEQDGGQSDGAIAPGPPTSNGPTPQTDTHWEIARTFITQFGYEWRYNVDARRWYRFTGETWQPSDTVIETLGEMMAGQSDLILQVNGPQAPLRARMLKSMGAIASVRNMLQGHSAIVLSESDFDAHPHLLNTPAGVVDLRTGVISDHDPLLLLRQITLVAPGYYALGDYETHCPLFFRVLYNMAAGREWIILAIRHWFAYCLTGDLRHQSLMFLHGPPGVGKSQIVQAIFEILSSYAHLIDESSFSKNGGETKRFDMADWIGKRMGFMDETQLGMTFDETRMSKTASAEYLSAELKFGRRVKFPNTLKITIVGNHKPNFVAAETGGLTSRMLLVEAGGTCYRDAVNEIKRLSRRMVEEEGEAILMWAIEACVADYCTPGLFREAMIEPHKAAVEYAHEDSAMRQWGADQMCEKPDLNIDTMEAFKHFMEFARDLSPNKKAPNLKLSGFKQALQAVFPSITFGNRTTRPHPNRAFIKGFGYAPLDTDDMAENVVLFQEKKDMLKKADEAEES